MTDSSTDLPVDLPVPSPSSGTSRDGKLIRAVSRWEIVGLAVNDVIGSGVYLLPAAAALLLGAASIWAVVLAGLAVGLLVLCFASAASHFDETGSGYLYTREAFGRFVGFEVGWMTWLARISSVAALSAGFALATSFLWPAASGGWVRAAVITVPLVVLTWINVVGVKQGARVAVGLAIAKTLPLLFFVGVGIFFVDWDLVTDIEVPGFDGLGEAALLLLFAYAGFENTAAPAGEYKNPQRNVPFALLMMITFVTLLYTLVQLVAVGTLPGLAQSESALAEAATVFLGAGAGIIMTIGAMISIEGNVGNTTLIGPRYLFALARDGFGPRILGEVHPKYRTPAAAIITQSTIALALALSGSFVGLAMLSIIARLATYVGTAAAVPVLRKRFADRPGVLHLPGGPLIPVAALLLCLAFLASATTANLIAGVVALLVGVVIYGGKPMSVINLVMAALFVFGAVVQFNDPDKFVWIVIYLLAAGVCVLAYRRPAVVWPAALVALGCLVWAATLGPDVLGQIPFGDMFGAWEMRNIGIERSREMYGLVIIAAWMVAIALNAFRSRRRATTAQ
jgi:amino acid transporter